MRSEPTNHMLTEGSDNRERINLTSQSNQYTHMDN
eukprot:CAMPEP_0168625684 /NCGR_PEP_ID=MMETSP0449_2-20121227/10167_1 /TAXON_ID=1082188 /ORGANISM="Strombidium rassoulzadegani, Strain ras09" /LENGTH=34 /DNA_ID= /DNA_START= /DNA_END= /DNA_ORIENTATION=